MALSVPAPLLGDVMTALEMLKIEVRRLSAEIEYQHVRRFVEMPNGWESLNLLSTRARLSAAMFGPPNYGRLVLAKNCWRCCEALLSSPDDPGNRDSRRMGRRHVRPRISLAQVNRGLCSVPP